MIDFLDVVRAEAARCSHLLRTADHGTVVPYLPGWTVGDVGAHLAGDYVWATRILTDRTPIRTGLTSVPETGTALCDAFDRHAEAMLAALHAAAADPAAPCPNFAEGARGRAGWWVRHQAHETTLHRWDLETPGPHAPVDPLLAADGVDELLHVYTARYGPFDLDGPLLLEVDGGPAWRVTPTGGNGRVRVERLTVGDEAPDDEVPGTAARVTADPAALLLLLWGRIGVDDPAVAVRRPDVVRRFLDGPVTA